MTTPQTTPELHACPFCSHPVPKDLSDTLYPSGIYWREDPEIGRHYIRHSDEISRAEDDNRCWQMNCTQNMGGCGASISADSREEVIAKWNTRAATQERAAPLEGVSGMSRERPAPHAASPMVPSERRTLIFDYDTPASPQPLAPPDTGNVGAETIARQFHEAYERLAPSFGYETRPETRAFDPASPNGRLMIAVCREVALPPPGRGMVPMTDGQIEEFWQSHLRTSWQTTLISPTLFARAIEAHHGIKEGS